MKKQFKIPKFKNEDAELKFWSEINLTNYFKPQDFVRVTFPNLKPTSRSISIRMPGYLLDRLKEKAHEIDVPYHSLIKGILTKELAKV
ncbi:MAG: hypothetical protein BWY26_01263 [Elusimicrobia bacterium ADurb.Bin231]|nr:MAG: hypothetical protein BWY26_01263 [Elusimicrobia bacterium ADurb.Bin231]